jgi:regulator of protease activity HflC (stomatin/prohibitin superfamily)
MLDRLIDLITEFISLFQIYTFIDEYERGVVLRCGKYNRTVGPGWTWILPLNLEQVLVDNVVPTTTELGVQSLHTKDGYHINIQGVLLWKITDIRKILIDVEDADDALTDAATGIISDMVAENDWDEIRGAGFSRRLKSLIQEQAREWGIRVMKVYISDCSKTRAVRMWHEGISLEM